MCDVLNVFIDIIKTFLLSNDVICFEKDKYTLLHFDKALDLQAELMYYCVSLKQKQTL